MKPCYVISMLLVGWLFHLIPLYPDEVQQALAVEVELNIQPQPLSPELIPAPEPDRSFNATQREMDAIDSYFVLARQVRKLSYARIYLTIRERERPEEWLVTVVVDKGMDLMVARTEVSLAAQRTMELTGRVAGLRICTIPECDCQQCRKPGNIPKEQKPTPAKRPS